MKNKQTQNEPKTGQLVLAATPIGNLADASSRLKDLLTRADLIAVEDTRTFRKLIAGLGIRSSGKIISYHDHNEAQRQEQILKAVAAGQLVLILSDAGMPTISDPGLVTVQAVTRAQLPVTVAPGPSAVTTALALSGLASARFCFEGFLARKGSERSRRLAALAQEERTMVFYESPHRTAKTLADFVATFGPQRQAAICRELTKIHEEVIRGPLEELADWAQGQTLRGEIVLVVAGADSPAAPEPEQLVAEVENLTQEGIRLKEASTRLAKQYPGLSSRQLYQATLAARQNQT